MTAWPKARARVRRGCTLLGLVTALTCAALVSFGHLPAVDAFGATWAAFLALLLVALAYAAAGDLVRKLFVILETEEERMEFFLQVCCQLKTHKRTYIRPTDNSSHPHIDRY